jgi:hypothetical protein
MRVVASRESEEAECWGFASGELCRARARRPKLLMQLSSLGPKARRIAIG